MADGLNACTRLSLSRCKDPPPASPLLDSGAFAAKSIKPQVSIDKVMEAVLRQEAMFQQFADQQANLHSLVHRQHVELCEKMDTLPQHANGAMQDPAQMQQMVNEAFSKMVPRDAIDMPSLLKRGTSEDRAADNEDLDMSAVDTLAHKGRQKSNMSSSSSAYNLFCDIVRSDRFELFIGVVIVFNTITMALESQYNGEVVGAQLSFNRSAHPPKWMKTSLDTVNDALLFIFVAELGLKLLAYQMDFIVGKQKYWNLVDFFVVAFGVMDRYSIVELGLDPVMLRLLRLVKLTRFLKLFKTLGNSLQTMMLILKSVRAAGRTLFWSMLLLFVIQYVIGMIASQLISSYLLDETQDLLQRSEVFQYYGTFTKTQLTMFEITHVNYAQAVRLLCDNISEWWGWFFVIYRMTVAFAFLAVIRAVFIQSTLRVAEQDKELLLANKRRVANELEEQIKDIFGTLFGDIADTENFEIGREDFLKVMRKDATKVWLSALDIDTSYPEGLFSLMDLNGGGGVSVAECVYVAKKIRGPARAVDLYYLHGQVERMEMKLDALLPAALRGDVYPEDLSRKSIFAEKGHMEGVHAKAAESMNLY